jgi:hypothetical protein
MGCAAEIIFVEERAAGSQFPRQRVPHELLFVVGASLVPTGHEGHEIEVTAGSTGIFDRKLERAQMVAAFQPNRAQRAIQVAEGRLGGCLQVEPEIASISTFDDQVKPGARRSN